MDNKGPNNDATEGENDVNSRFLDMYSTIYGMRQDLEKVRKPLGTRENPARSCRDLYFGHPHFSDGTNQVTVATMTQFFFGRVVLD